MPSNLTSISFPASPALNDTYTYGNQTYQWNGTEWVVSYDSNSIPIGAVTLSGNQTITGVKTFSNNIVANGGITGNVTGDLTGTIQTAAQPNITSLGTLSSATISGNLTVDTNTLFVNSSNDRVGIGTTSPSEKLEVNGNIKTTNITLGTGPAIFSPTGTQPIYGCRAWVKYDATSSGTWVGGVSTATRSNGNNTATITTTNNHNLLTGHAVSISSGLGDAANTFYGVTVTGAKTFTVTTTATTALTNATVTFNTRLINGSGNIHSVMQGGVAGDNIINFAVPMDNANYCTVLTAGDSTSGGGHGANNQINSNTYDRYTLRIETLNWTGSWYANPLICVAVFA